MIPLYCASKPIVATAVLGLVSAGEVDLDDTLDRFGLARLLPNASDTTIRGVLSHSTPLPDVEALIARMVAPRRRAELLSFPLNDASPTNPLYSVFVGWWMLAEVLSHVSGLSYGHAVRALVLDPYGISPDELWMQPGVSETFDSSRVVTQYQQFALGRALPLCSDSFGEIAHTYNPAFSAYGTTEALSRFYRGVLNDIGGANVVLEPEVAELVTQVFSKGIDRATAHPFAFSLGFRVQLNESMSPLLSPRSFGHPADGGAVLGFADPQSDVALAFAEPVMIHDFEAMRSRREARIASELDAVLV